MSEDAIAAEETKQKSWSRTSKLTLERREETSEKVKNVHPSLRKLGLFSNLASQSRLFARPSFH